MAKTSSLKIPPQSLEAEHAVLGSILIDKNAIFKVADTLELVQAATATTLFEEVS